MKTGVIDVGGGMRGIYVAGIFDRLMDSNIYFDVAYGISAGSANVVAYTAGQRGRNKLFYTEYSRRKEYMGLGLLFKKHVFLDLDYVYGTLSNSDGENPLNYPALAKAHQDIRIIATNANTGEPTYFTKADIHQDNYDILKASSALPVACKPWVIDGVPYFDGALSDPVPIQKALDEGCDKIVLLLTQPLDMPMHATRDLRCAKLIERRYPQAAEGLRLREKRCKEGIKFAQKLSEEGKLLMVSPQDTFGVDTLSKDAPAIEKLYQSGYNDAQQISEFL